MRVGQRLPLRPAFWLRVNSRMLFLRPLQLASVSAMYQRVFYLRYSTSLSFCRSFTMPSSPFVFSTSAQRLSTCFSFRFSVDSLYDSLLILKLIIGFSAVRLPSDQLAQLDVRLRADELVDDVGEWVAEGLLLGRLVDRLDQEVLWGHQYLFGGLARLFVLPDLLVARRDMDDLVHEQVVVEAGLLPHQRSIKSVKLPHVGLEQYGRFERPLLANPLEVGRQPRHLLPHHSQVRTAHPLLRLVPDQEAEERQPPAPRLLRHAHLVHQVREVQAVPVEGLGVGGPGVAGQPMSQHQPLQAVQQEGLGEGAQEWQERVFELDGGAEVQQPVQDGLDRGVFVAEVATQQHCVAAGFVLFGVDGGEGIQVGLQ